MSGATNNPGGVGIFPNVTLRTDSKNGAIIETYIRKQHSDGKWYLNHVCQVVEKNLDTASMLNRFMRDCYLFLLYGKIVPELEIPLLPGVKVFKLDECQTSEEERLWEQYGVKVEKP